MDNNTIDLGIAGCGAALIELAMGTINGRQRNFVILLSLFKIDPSAQSYSVPLISLKGDAKCSKVAVAAHMSLLDLSKLYSVHA